MNSPLLAVEAEPMKISPRKSFATRNFRRQLGVITNVLVVSLLLKRLSIRGWPAGSPKDAEDCLAFVCAKNIKCMVETFPLHKAQEAFDRREKARFRAVIVP